MFWDDIIEAGDPRWEESLRRCPRHDFYHLPDYVALEAERRSGQAKAYLCQQDGGLVLVPYIESPVPLVMQPGGEAPNDVLAPYGYCGPLLYSDGGERESAQFFSLALSRLAEHLRHRNICSMLLRLHPLFPLPTEAFRAQGRLVFHGETVWSDLRDTPEQIWSDTRGRYRSYIHALQRQGFRVELDPAGREMFTFIDLYYETMRRVHASPEYFFSMDYFRSLQRLLGPRFMLAHVRSPAGEIVSSSIFTVCQGVVQYYLSGNNIGEEGANALKLLLHEVRGWAQATGQEKFHFGGGVGARKDSLFQFKSGFSSRRAPFYTWRMVVDDENYSRLCRRWERLNRVDADPIDGYFPAYRKMIPPQERQTERRCA